MKISLLIFVGFTLILLLFSITTFVNYKQSQQVKENTDYVVTSQAVIRNATRLQRNFIEMESDLRGFLFTGEEIFLEPYKVAILENDELFLSLDSLVHDTDTSAQRQKLKEIRQLHGQWEKEFAEPLILSKTNANLSDSAAEAFDKLYRSRLRSKEEDRISNEIQAKFREFTNYEYDLRAIRRANLEASVVGTREISFFLTTMSIIVGLAISVYIAYLISKRIHTMVDLAERIAQGNFNVLIKDTTKDELGKLARSLNSMARILNENITELERKNKELDQFAYVVSHDLKAPLRGIENVSYWIEEDFGKELSPKVQDYLSLMRGRIRRLENLINGILELSRIGKKKKPLEEVNVRFMLQEIVEMLSPSSDIQIRISKNMPVFMTERIPLQQVFTNLISNAIKYHHTGYGKINISCKETERYYEFSVIDDGPGIEPQYHEKIFVIFQTLKERDAFESTGVGLAIVKKILDDKKCDIKVVSEVGKGATFSFTWPK